MQELQNTLDSMANQLADLDKQKKKIESEESEIKVKMLEIMKQNNLSAWPFEKGSITHHSRISYSNWNFSAMKSKIGQDQFDEVIQIKIGVLKKKLTGTGIVPEKHDDYLSTIATPNKSEWVRLNNKKKSG